MLWATERAIVGVTMLNDTIYRETNGIGYLQKSKFLDLNSLDFSKLFNFGQNQVRFTFVQSLSSLVRSSVFVAITSRKVRPHLSK